MLIFMLIFYLMATKSALHVFWEHLVCYKELCRRGPSKACSILPKQYVNMYMYNIFI